mgnify:FL=1
MVAVNKLSWRGDVRVCLHVADATAHGYCKDLSYVSDNYPSGRCPDQQAGWPDLAGATRELAHTNKVDFVFCECNPSRTADLRKMYSDTYGGGDGFGVLPLDKASSFKEKILAALSSALLNVMVSDNVSGLQSFAGNNLSSIISTMNSSLRESLGELSDVLKGLGVDEDKDEDKEDGNDEMKVTEEDEDDEEEKGPDISSIDDKTASITISEEDEGKMKVEGEGDGTSVTETKTKKPTRTDYDRLVTELQGKDLHPVRLLLGMPISSNLALSAGKQLLEAGLSVQDLQNLGYPSSIVQVFVDAAADSISAL